MTQYQNFTSDAILIRYITKYRVIINIDIFYNKNVTFIQAQKQDVNINQRSMRYLDNKMCLWIN